MISIPGRIPIHIFPFFWLLILMIGWLNSFTIQGTVIWAVVIFFSVLIHEYGHALTARAFGQEAEINLVGLGGLTKREGKSLLRWKEFLIVLNGPLAGFLLFFLTYQLFPLVSEIKHPFLFYALEVSVNVNLFWTILNLLPVLPLDGGHLMRILLEGLLGVKGIKASLMISLLLAVFIGLYFMMRQDLLIGALFFMLAFESYRAWLEVKSMAPHDDDQHLQQMVREGINELQAGRLEEAFEKLVYVRQQAPKGILYVTATENAAHILAMQGKYKQAYDWLYPLHNRLTPHYERLLQQLAYRTQEWEEAVKIGQKAYQQEPSMDVAVLNAICYAVMGKATPAVGWLRCAVQLGLSNVDQFIAKREFDAIRDSDVFQSWLKSERR